VRLDACTDFSFFHVSGGAKNWSVFSSNGLSDLVSGASCELMIAGGTSVQMRDSAVSCDCDDRVGCVACQYRQRSLGKLLQFEFL